MASTRRAPPLQVHEDPDASQLNRSDHDIESALLNALGPLGDASNQQNFRLPPSNHSRPGSSPTKQPSSPTQPLDTTDLKEITIPPPPPPKFATDSPRKGNVASFMPMYPPPVQQQQQQQQAQPLFTRYPLQQPYDKENHYDAMMYQGFRPMPYNEIQYAPPLSTKRPHPDETESQPKDKAIKKQKLDRDDGFELPDPEDMPPVYDDGAKPQHSYAELIGMAILRSPTRRLTLAQIYKWISDHFSFYKSSDSGWQNSIRHNLSLNKNFIKQERPKDDPGKGNYWAIKPGEERPFLLGRKNPMRRITNPDGSQYLHALPAEMGGFRPATAPAISQFTLAPTPSSAAKKAEAKVADSVKLPDEGDVSSDATIPASDAGLQDDERDDAAAMPPPPSHFRSSPPPADIGSSPPQMPAPQRRGTPPPAPRFPSTSRSGSRRQKFSRLGDSGYWSSIESSAVRNNPNHLTSEADIPRPRIKKGRAEAEIARMRSSSFDSPIKERPNIRLSASELPTSSPVRDDQPLTPAVVFKRPPKPPPSVSPNTNLRNHRNRMRALLGTPAKLFNAVEHDTPNWSPAFHLGEDGTVGLTPGISPYKASKTPWRPFQDLATEVNTSNNSLFNSAFDVFIDAPEEDLTARGSPEKRTNPTSSASARRPSLARAATSTGILADITGSSRSNFVTLAPPASGNNSPFSLSPFIVKPAFQHSPNKAHGTSPLKQAHLPPPSSHGSAGQGQASPPKWGLQDDLPGIDTENLHPGANLAGGASAVGTEDAGTTVRTTDIDAAVDLFGVHLPSDGSEEGIDLFQDFGKIGASFQQQQHTHHHSVSLGLPGAPNTADGSPIKRTTLSAAAGGRPALGRHMSNRW